MRATTSGCEMVWPWPIGSAELRQASSSCSGPTKASRGTAASADSRRSTALMCGSLEPQHGGDPLVRAEIRTVAQRQHLGRLLERTVDRLVGDLGREAVVDQQHLHARLLERGADVVAAGRGAL